MDLIEHTYSIQWVGPMNYEEFKKYLCNNDTLDRQYFNLYYFEARMDARYKLTKYFGIHKENDGISKRVNPSHEHLGPFIKNNAKHIKIWIGSFALESDQQPDKIDIVETLFVRAYADILNDNTKKKKALPDGSICVVNSYYDIKDNQMTRKSQKPDTFDDVLVYYSETNCFMRANLTKMK